MLSIDESVGKTNRVQEERLGERLRGHSSLVLLAGFSTNEKETQQSRVDGAFDNGSGGRSDKTLMKLTTIIRFDIPPTDEEIEHFLDKLDEFPGEEVVLKEDDRAIVCYAFEKLEELKDEKEVLRGLLSDLVDLVESENSAGKEFDLKTLLAHARDALATETREET